MDLLSGLGDDQAAMEPTAKRSDDITDRYRSVIEEVAAMEPTAKRSDDA